MRSPSAPLSVGLGVGLTFAFLLTLFVTVPVETALSREADRTLRLYFAHTGEHGEFTFKRNGRYDRSEIARINHFLRDWRKEEDARIDPQLLDLVWAIYRESGSRDEIHVVSAYRSPQTNSMLRSRSSGVAKNSQHIQGKAMDWFVTDVPLAQLRGIAMKMQGGGVGYYPTSGSPFIHTDTGSVRAWPRMSRQQLLALFPNGKTLHLPADGQPLPGYEVAVAERKAAGTTTLAYLEPEADDTDAASSDESRGVGSWLRRVLPGGKGNDATTADEATDSSGGEQLVASAEDDEAARTPRPRPGESIGSVLADASSPAVVTPADSEMVATLAYAPVPRTRPDPMLLASSLSGGQAAAPLPVAAAPLAPPMPRPAPAAADDPIALAFAAAEELPTQEDAAIVAAFTALQNAAEERRGGLASLSEPATPEPAHNGDRPIIVTAALNGPIGPATGSFNTGAQAQATAPAVSPTDQLPGYGADQGAMERLIAPAPAYNPQSAGLAMPVPTETAAIYRAPETGRAVTAMNDASNLPVERFAGGEDPSQPAERGFFMRLFASLIE